MEKVIKKLQLATVLLYHTELLINDLQCPRGDDCQSMRMRLSIRSTSPSYQPCTVNLDYRSTTRVDKQKTLKTTSCVESATENNKRARLFYLSVHTRERTTSAFYAVVTTTFRRRFDLNTTQFTQHDFLQEINMHRAKKSCRRPIVQLLTKLMCHHITERNT